MISFPSESRRSRTRFGRWIRSQPALVLFSILSGAVCTPPPPATNIPEPQPQQQELDPPGDSSDPPPTLPPPPPPPATTEIALQLVAEGLTAPVDLVEPPDGSGRLFIVDQVGQIRIVDAAGAMIASPFLDLTDRLTSLDSGNDERGLLGIAFHPAYAANGRFFVFYNPADPGTPTGFSIHIRVSEFIVSSDANVADASSERALLTIGKPQNNHNGGQIAFGPDGLLYVSVGDGGGAGDTGTGHNPTIGNAQDKATLLGKILRIDVDSGSPYGVPADNPFVSDPNARPEIFALGARNPWRFSFDSGGAHRLFVADVGQRLFEEVSIVVEGDNLGWRIREGASCFDTATSANPLPQCADTAVDGAPFVAPILHYPHANSSEPSGRAIIGGHIYRGMAIAGLAGRYVFGDWSKSQGAPSPNGSVFRALEGGDGNWTMAELAVRDRPGERLGEYLLGVGRDASGELYLLTSLNRGPSGNSGKVYQIVP
jgi:glucose/arabinose dehydrogenase